MCEEWKNSFARFLKDMGGKMPDGCNTIALRDETKDFCRANCYWTFSNRGPKSIDQKKTDKAYKKKCRSSIKNPKSIFLTLEKEHVDYIRSQALQMSMSRGVYIEANQLIREALVKAFPLPSQYDMFGAELQK